MDIGERYTERELAQIEKRLKSIYKEAEQDMGKKLREFNKAHKERDAKYRAAVKAGKMSKEDYQAWLQGQVFQGDQWKAKREQMAKSLTHANEQAMAVVNNTRFNVFAENANFMEYEIGMGAGMLDAQFGLYDTNTVKRLVAEQPNLLPPSKVSIPKDMAWNQKKITRAVTQGIIQGEGIDAIAERMAEVSGTTRQAMVLHARTAMTGAQNAGRIEGMLAAQRLGLNVKKQWMATLDSHTRDAHQDLDGQVQEVKEPFQSILGDIMYPGDPGAEPANVYNCRCTLIYVFDDEEFTGERRDNETGEDIEYKTYREWKDGLAHAAKAVDIPAAVTYDVKGNTKKLLGALGDTEYAEAVQMIEKSETAKLYARYGDECRGIVQAHGAGEYRPGMDTVYFGLENKPGMHKYSTMCHEMGHMFDKHIGEDSSLSFREVNLINQRCVIGSGARTTLQVLPSQSDQFLGAMRRDKETLRKLLKDPDALREMKTGIARNASAGVQDAMDGFFGTQDKGLLPWGHGNSYYNRAYNRRIKGFDNEGNLKQAFLELGFDASNQTKCKTLMRDYETASELWANAVSAVTCGGPELEAFEQYMPETMKAVRAIIGGLK